MLNTAEHTLQLCDNYTVIMKGAHPSEHQSTSHLAKSNSLPAVLQRVKLASVTVNDQLVSTIGRGILVLAGVGKGDDEKEADNLVGKVLKMRLWPDENGGQVSWPAYGDIGWA